MPKKYLVRLTDAEREQLHALIRSGRSSARQITRARILLKSDAQWGDQQIADALEVAVATVERIRKRFAQEGLSRALAHKEQKRRKQRVLDGAAEARLSALACSAAPGGRKRWTMELLAAELVRLEVVPAVGAETVRKTLKKTR